jgi:hypothetical protein
MEMQMLQTLDKAKLNIENARGLNLAVVKLTTVEVNELSL